MKCGKIKASMNLSSASQVDVGFRDLLVVAFVTLMNWACGFEFDWIDGCRTLSTQCGEMGGAGESTNSETADLRTRGGAPSHPDLSFRTTLVDKQDKHEQREMSYELHEVAYHSALDPNHRPPFPGAFFPLDRPKMFSHHRGALSDSCPTTKIARLESR